MFEYAENATKSLLFKELLGNIPVLLKHKEASTAIDYVYSSVATPKQQKQLAMEFYGPEYAILSRVWWKGERGERQSENKIIFFSALG